MNEGPEAMAQAGQRESPGLPTLAGIRDAAAAIGRHLAPTPLVRCQPLSRALRAEVWLKNETVTPIGSFKLRGALNALLRARAAGEASAAVTSSTGNHGQGVAYAASLLRLAADVFLPHPANPLKKAMIEVLGGTVHEVGRDIDEAKDRAKDHAAASGRLFVDDGDSLDMMEGAGTVALEVAQALDGVDALMVPMGGGNLVGGSGAAMRALAPESRVIAIQAKGAPAMVESFHARRPLEREIDPLADGLVCRVPANLALEAMWAFVDDAWLTSDEDLLGAVHALAECAHVLVEPAGAAALAGTWTRRRAWRGKRIVLVLTGANITTDLLERALATPPLVSLGDALAGD